MVRLDTGSTDTLSAAFLRDLRTLLDAAFDGDFSDDDWAHTIGGVHVWIARDSGSGSELISHGSVVPRTMTCDGHALRVGYVEAVATVADRRREGHGSAVMARLNEVIGERYDLGVLSTGTPEFYETIGWERWRGPTFVDTPDAGRQRTADDDGGVMILRTPRSPRVDLDGAIVCDWRPGDVW
jgi:aminoglycoside 2'-N-acetyltransferase I